MIKVLFDCDNTMGVKNRDVDDGLTLLYLLGNKDIDLLGITTTFGNSDINTVYDATKELLNDINVDNIPLYKGGPSPKNRSSKASDFLIDTVNKYPNEITLLATGSLTNLYDAYNKDNNFFNKVKEIVLMGGITEPLVINGKNLDELNFASDPEAAYNVLSSSANTTVITGHICLQALFSRFEYNRLISEDNPIYHYIRRKTIPWYEFIMDEFGIEGFFNWDIVAAVYITNPEFFDESILKVSSTPEDLKTGYLKADDTKKEYPLNIPTSIKNIKDFNNIIFDSWSNLEI